MAKFLQDTIEDMTVSSKNAKKKESVQEFAAFIEKVSKQTTLYACTCTVILMYILMMFSNSRFTCTTSLFVHLYLQVRTSGAQADTAEILKFSKLFQNEITLDNLSRKQLQALCRYDH